MYEYADRVLRTINRNARSTFAKRKAAPFDQLDIIAESAILYDELRRDCVEQFKRIAQYYGSEDASWLSGFLENVYPVTRYAFNTEVYRKRDRMQEALMATGGQKKEYDRALLYWAQMVGWFAVAVTDEALIRKYVSQGVTHVLWNTVPDERRCKKCRALSGKVFRIDNVPPKPHPGCRCYLTPVI